MFSAQQLQNFAKKKRISQETFDEAVQENITEFDMEPEEAVASAISEFESQGVDLSNIITTANGGNLSGHPAADAAAQLEAALGEGDLVDAVQAIVALQTALCGGDLGENSAAVAMSVNAVPLTLRCLSAAIGAANPSAQKASLQALAAFLSLSAAVRASFREGHGPRSVAQLLEAATASDNTTNPEIAAATLAVAAASARGDEDGKCALMDLGVGVLALRTLGSSWAADMQEAVLAACATLSALTTADDTSQPSSRAFPNARSLAKDGAAEVLVEALRTSTSTGSETTSALCSTLRLIAANDEICQQAAGAGAVALAMQVQESAVAQSNPSLARAALSLLRQLASSDAVKAAMLEGGSMPAVKSALDFAGDAAEAAVAEAALGFLANLALRNPDASKAAVEEGCAPAIVQTMRSMLALCSSAGGPKAAGRAPAALRQGCMAVRNMAVRSEEARAALLEAGAEAVVRQARAEAPTGCGDVGSAALRDMGLDDYQ